MSAKGWTMTVAAVGVAAGTYFTLGAIYPPQKEKVKGPELAPVDAVFSRTLPQNGAATAGATPRAAPDAAAATEASVDAGYDTGYAADDDSDLALSDDRYADEPEPEPEPEPAPTPAPAATAAPAPSPTAAATVRPVETPSATAAPAPRPATAAAPAAKPAAPIATAAPAQPVTRWWGPESPERLSVVYAGSAAYTRAIVLMFNGAFADAAAAQQHLRVTEASGKTIAGTWEVGASNRRMLLFPVPRSGSYTVHLGADLADSNGRRLGSELKGPVRVQ